MAGLFESLSAFTVFLAISGIGFAFLIVSFIFGEAFEHFGFDHDIDHDLDGGGGPSFFSPRVLSVFITAFGGAGAIATYYGLSTLPASGVGLLTGGVFGAMIYAFAHFLFGQQASTEVKTLDFVGKTARVIISIPKDGVGQVRCQIGEEMVDKVARSEDGKAIAENTPVKVQQMLGEMMIVKRV